MVRKIIFICLIFPYSILWSQVDIAIDRFGDPFIYTEWESFTTESTEGKLINDHILFLESDGDSLWIGTEGGLILYYNGFWKSWTADDGLPWKVVPQRVSEVSGVVLWILSTQWVIIVPFFTMMDRDGLP